MYPAVRELKQELSKKIVFIVADFRNSETQRLAAVYGVRFVPDFVVLSSSGQVAAREGGAMPKEELRNLILEGVPR